ncbi:Acylphosphatase [Methanocella conradii HZ254]|uniref:acylphosphatase n=1 Tax=Methanocella conradii (strain DSM 24694 / JCM 17849 / CGMCC 1.5162 / HZ254) TaxID=1041930 RepID=H8I966_METCZ|nr:acylphosphatase [Methanocella conradii]AFC99069.1 Acylphosphatase [Methanocella conradii HZ254]
MKAVDVIVSGRVQAVGFRAFTMRNALMLGVRGYVENLEDGRVHAVLEGDDHQVDKLLEMMRQGPRSARVEGVTVRPVEAAGYQGFDAR